MYYETRFTCHAIPFPAPPYRLFCLYANDVCMAAGGRDTANSVVSGLLLACFVIFSLEIIAASLTVKGYFLSFFFWVDLIGTFSLVFDIKWCVDLDAVLACHVLPAPAVFWPQLAVKL